MALDVEGIEDGGVAIGCDGSRRTAGVAARRADPSPQCAMLDGGQQQGAL